MKLTIILELEYGHKSFIIEIKSDYLQAIRSHEIDSNNWRRYYKEYRVSRQVITLVLRRDKVPPLYTGVRQISDYGVNLKRIIIQQNLRFIEKWNIFQREGHLSSKFELKWLGLGLYRYGLKIPRA